MTVKQPPCHLAYSEVAFSCAEADPEPAAPFGPGLPAEASMHRSSMVDRHQIASDQDFLAGRRGR